MRSRRASLCGLSKRAERKEGEAGVGGGNTAHQRGATMPRFAKGAAGLRASVRLGWELEEADGPKGISHAQRSNRSSRSRRGRAFASGGFLRDSVLLASPGGGGGSHKAAPHPGRHRQIIAGAKTRVGGSRGGSHRCAAHGSGLSEQEALSLRKGGGGHALVTQTAAEPRI